MCGNHAGLAGERTQILEPTTVEALAFVEDELANGGLLNAVKCFADNETGDVFLAEFCDKFLLHLVLEGVTRGLALELGLNEQRIGNSIADDRFGFGLNLCLNHARGEFALRLADRFAQFLLSSDDWSDRFLTELECGEEVGFREFIGRTLEHDHVLFVTDVDEVEVAPLHLSMGWVGDKFALNATDTHRANRPGERQVLIINAAEAPLIERTSESLSPSALSSRVWICTSLKYPLGNSGRIGRSVTRQVRISFSEDGPRA